MSNHGDLIEAIHRDRLASVADHEAAAVCAAIGRRVAAEVDAAIEQLRAAGVDATPLGDPARPQQRHGAILDLADADAAFTAVDVLAASGYRPWDPIDGAAGLIHRRFQWVLTLAKTTDLTMTLNLRWPRPQPGARVPEAFVPNANDFDAVSIPKALWPSYFVVRPLRLAAERVGIRRPSNRALGPFLSTPDQLVEPLLDLAQLHSDSVLVDLGCGDGRVLRAAAKRHGCRAIGVESDPGLAAEAERLVSEAALGDTIEIVNADALDSIPLVATKATAYFVFVPAHAANDLIKRLLAEAQSGAVVVAHEQHALPDPPPGAESFPLLTDQGVTVAHRWTAG